jgi:hypothetical protein
MGGAAALRNRQHRANSCAAHAATLAAGDGETAETKFIDDLKYRCQADTGRIDNAACLYTNAKPDLENWLALGSVIVISTSDNPIHPAKLAA